MSPTGLAWKPSLAIWTSSSRPPTPWAATDTQAAAGSEQPFHQHDVEPPAELPADLALDTDLPETARRMQRDGRLVVADNPRHYRVEPVRGSDLNELLQKEPADPAA